MKFNVYLGERMSIDFNKLKEEMPFKWKVQTANEWNCSCVAYVDSRQVQDKLDDVVGASNWQDRYLVVDGQLHCEIGIYDDVKKEWVWKGDCGTESMTEKEKGQASDAFKRAAVKWGVGRFLYSMEIQKLKSGKGKNGKFAPFDNNGRQIYDVTKHINEMNKGASQSNSNSTYDNDEKPSNEYTPSASRYSEEKSGKNASYSKATVSESVMAKVRSLNKNGKTGGEVLKFYIPSYNAKNGTSIVASELNNDEIINSFISFIDNQPPSDF
jgi:hypothetical protein